MQRPLLIVDDDPDIRQVLKANLELHGFATLTAASCAEARQLLDRQLPALVVLDLMLPDGDGMEICRALKKEPPRIPVIMLTARDRLSDKVTGLDSGADDYVVKPFETLELVARIKACLRRAAPAEDALTVGALHLDPRSRRVSVRGSEIELTPKEYDLLHLLVTARPEPVSRAVIRKTLWQDEQPYAWSRVIDVHIQHLRQKIETNPSEPEYILTVVGVGYRFRT
ncbi:MAG: response regulator transcription factor [Candidatus Methylomirabilales bacterium]